MSSTATSQFGEQAEVFLRSFLHAARNAMQRGQSSLSLLRLEAVGRPEMLELIAEAERGDEALNALFEAARRHVVPLAVDARPIDVVASMRSAWRDSVTASAGADLLCEPDTLLWAVDEALLASALQALFRNAAQARPAGLQVRARCRVCRDDGGSALEVSVQDNGPGLDERQRTHALEPFWSTRAGGLGMGLPHARRVAEAHGGRLTLDAGGSGGLRVVMVLPERAE